MDGVSNFEAHGLRLVCNFPFRSFLFTMEFSDGIGMRGISRVQGRKYVCCMEYGRRFGHSFRMSSTNVARLFVYLSLKSEKNMMKEKLVFVTNDDGYNSRGIQALLEVARKFGRVVAIAPETPQSGMSQAITINNPLFLREVSKGDGVEVYAFREPGRLREDRFRLLSRRAARSICAFGDQSRLEFGGQYPLFGYDGRCDREQFLRLSCHRAFAGRSQSGGGFRSREDLQRAHRACGGRGQSPTPFCLNVNIPKGRPEAVKGIRVCRQNKGYWREEFSVARSSGPGVFLADGCVRQ